MTTTEPTLHELYDIYDLNPGSGEYVSCKERQPFTIFTGETIEAFTPDHATRTYIARRWDSKCECCNHRLRYCFVTQDAEGEWHCFGQQCCNVKTNDGPGAAKWRLYSRVDEKKEKDAFVATFNVPQKLWDLPREKRPEFVRLWKGEARTRSGRGKQVKIWKMSIWAGSLEECIRKCIELEGILGVQLC